MFWHRHIFGGNQSTYGSLVYIFFFINLAYTKISWQQQTALHCLFCFSKASSTISSEYHQVMERMKLLISQAQRFFALFLLLTPGNHHTTTALVNLPAIFAFLDLPFCFFILWELPSYIIFFYTVGILESPPTNRWKIMIFVLLLFSLSLFFFFFFTVCSLVWKLCSLHWAADQTRPAEIHAVQSCWKELS